MTRPKKLKVGHLSWEVFYLKDKDWPDDSRNKCGLTYPMKQQFLIRTSDDTFDYSEGNIQEILLHEILHGIYHVTALGQYPKSKGEDAEEYIVAMMTPTLLSVLRDNPVLVRYLQA